MNDNNYEEIKAKIRELQESGVDLSFITQGVKPLKTDAIENAEAKIRELQESGVDLSFITQGAKPLKTDAIENAEAKIKELQEYGLPETATEELMEATGRHK